MRDADSLEKTPVHPALMDRLEKALKEAQNQNDFSGWAILKKWQERFATPLDTASAAVGCIKSKNDVLHAFSAIKRAMPLMNQSVPNRYECELITALVLVLADRRIRSIAEVPASAPDTLALNVSSASAASVIAACSFGCGLKLMGANGLEFANVIGGLEAIEFSPSDAGGKASGKSTVTVQKALEAEILAICSCFGDENFSRVYRSENVGYFFKMKLDSSTLRYEVDELSSQHNVQPVVVMDRNSASAAALREQWDSLSDLGVKAAFFKTPEAEGGVYGGEVEDEITLHVVDRVFKRILQIPEENRVVSKKNVFISYSHKDPEWLAALQLHLDGLVNSAVLEYWSDEGINTGDKWCDEILKAIAKSSVAICLISPGFLASKFIKKEEIPKMLERRERDGMKIIPLLVKPCRFDEHKWIKDTQMRPRGNPEMKSLEQLKAEPGRVDAELKKVMDDLVVIINSAQNRN